MKVAIGSDHRGYKLKSRLKDLLEGRGHEVMDLGTGDQESVDYPDYAFPVSGKVAAGEADRGILICGSGIGMSIAANKVRGIRAALCRTVWDAEMTRKHNDSNVLALSEKSGDDPAVDEVVLTWINTPFEGGRHLRRINKIADYEALNQ